MRTFFIISCLFFISTSCKKDKVLPVIDNTIVTDTIVEIIDNDDTIHSSDYICAYPGSWWIFSDNTVSACDYWHKIPVNVSKKIENTVYKKMYYITVPKIDSYYIFGEGEALANENVDSSKIKPRISFSIGQFYNETVYFGGGSDFRQIIGHGILDTLDVGSQTFYDVLKIEEKVERYFAEAGSGGGYFWTIKKYYAKNIGLIKVESQYVNFPPEIVELTDFYIAPH